MDDFLSTFCNMLCAFLGLASLAIVVTKCSSDNYDRYDPYCGAQPGPACDYENTLPPTYE